MRQNVTHVQRGPTCNLVSQRAMLLMRTCWVDRVYKPDGLCRPQHGDVAKAIAFTKQQNRLGLLIEHRIWHIWSWDEGNGTGLSAQKLYFCLLISKSCIYLRMLKPLVWAPFLSFNIIIGKWIHTLGYWSYYAITLFMLCAFILEVTGCNCSRGVFFLEVILSHRHC